MQTQSQVRPKWRRGRSTLVRPTVRSHLLASREIWRLIHEIGAKVLGLGGLERRFGLDLPILGQKHQARFGALWDAEGVGPHIFRL